jgi:hypothetical protein
VIQTAGKRGLVDLRAAIGKLKQTSFYAAPSVLSALIGDLENESRD